MPADYKKIMITLDGSDFAAQALPHAKALAALYGAKLVLFQVVPDASSVSQILDANRNIMHIADRQEQFVDKANQTLVALVDQYNLHKIETTAIVESGHPAETIIDYAKAHQIDLIVMTTHGRSGLARWVYGSVADKVLRGATCPVLLVRSTPI
jgi:nucleotide-binding universal stress UspA family protein